MDYSTCKTFSRFDYLDFAKGIGILLVIWGHINSSGYISNFIYFFHMPLFFFISGMLFQGKKYNSFLDFLLHKTKKLLIPYSLYSVITWGIWCLYNLFLGYHVKSYWMPLFQTIFAQGSQDFLVHNTALWFVPCLFAIELIFYFLSRIVLWKSGIICIFFVFVNLFFVNLFGNTWEMLPWNFDTALMALPFFWGGFLIVSLVTHYKLQKIIFGKKLFSIILGCIFVLFLAIKALLGPRISMGHSNYGNNVFMFYICAFSGIFFVLIFSIIFSAFKERYILFIRFIKWIGINSFDFMSLNVPVKGIVIVISAKLLNIDQIKIWTRVSYSIIPFFITIIIVSFICFNINKYVRGKNA